MRQVILEIQGGAFSILGGFLDLVDALIKFVVVNIRTPLEDRVMHIYVSL